MFYIVFLLLLKNSDALYHYLKVAGISFSDYDHETPLIDWLVRDNEFFSGLLSCPFCLACWLAIPYLFLDYKEYPKQVVAAFLLYNALSYLRR